ncbi:MAG: hypothetical protein JSV68_03175 [Anaerolineaceae bacterium]|nr:MAG: hypothetical protein JSV68_03175 [Anaerolineaceae bacterium]
MLQPNKQNRIYLLLLVILFATLLTIVGTSAQAKSPDFPLNSGLARRSSNGAVSPQPLINPEGKLHLSSGLQPLLDLRGWDGIPDVERGQVLKPTSRTASSPITTWKALPNQGLGGSSSPYVRALAVTGSDLYVGGDFTQTGDGKLMNLGNIARYNLSSRTWHALANQGLDGSVHSLLVSGGDLYVGGDFTQTGDGTLANLGSVARYNIAAGTWHALPNLGMDGSVYSLAASGNYLYLGGFFDQTGDGALANLGHIARYDAATGVWNALPNQGLNNTVLDLVLSGSDLYVGGYFSETSDGTLTNLGCITRYDTKAGTWNALPHQGLGGGYWPMPSVRALALSGSNLYVGGNFTRTGDGVLANLGRIARYDIASDAWQVLPNQGLGGTSEPDVLALAGAGSDLYVGGDFVRTGDGTITNLGHTTSYDASSGAWKVLPSQGFNNYVGALAMSNMGLFVGGKFTQTGDGALSNLGYIALGTFAETVQNYVYVPVVLNRWPPAPSHHFEGSSPPVSFAVSGQQVCNFDITVPFITSYCKIDMPSDSCVNIINNSFLIEVDSDVFIFPLFRIEGTFDSTQASASGNYSVWICGNQLIVTPSTGNWAASKQ